MSKECSADLDRICNSGINGEPCQSCLDHEAYWQAWGKSLRFNRYSESEIRDVYSDPTDRSKREFMLSESGR